ncbi:uncharacterized protein LOC131634741 [Vicia villosa]|uniref:uncharacterized protein LOC131634741 n=1 Tax=Vicia villosa TaxID=3911 RepID=UPI00273CF063|nr:uncharacterized protein LOC131634741 [Vicia villosa]
METDVVKNTAPQTSIARKRRKLILKAKRDYRNRVRSSNLTSHLNHNFTSSVTYETTIETAMARKRRKIILDNRKRLRNLFNTEVSRVQNTNNIVSQSQNMDHASTSNYNMSSQSMDHPSTSNHNVSVESHYEDNDDSNSDNNLNSSSSSSSDEDSDPAQLQEAHLQEYYDIGDQSYECAHCQACMWYQEKVNRHKITATPRFYRCCRGGKIVLPFLEQPPQVLQDLLFNNTYSDSKNYQANIRTYNAMFSFTSPGMKFDTTYSKRGGPPTLRLQGQTCHRIGTLLPETGQPPQYAQLYIYDTDNEVEHKIKCFKDNKGIERPVVKKLKMMLDQHNVHAKAFRMARDVLRTNSFTDLKLRLISDRSEDARVYNKPTVSEVAALIVGDIDSADKRDILIQRRNGGLQRIDEFHPAYLAYQYPLIFPYGEDGYRKNIMHRYRHETEVTKRNRQSIKDWFSYRLQQRRKEAKTLLYSRRLFQQFLVDGYAMMEPERLNWLRDNQSKLRVGKYNNLAAQTDCDTRNEHQKRGKRVVLPSTFVGSKRYMDQLYFDGMAISSQLGFPDLFVTFTCNPNWPEIKRALSGTGLQPHDRPDIISKVFKIKFDTLMDDITKHHVVGKVIALPKYYIELTFNLIDMYTIEFQKRGLPHAHILIFLHPKSKYPTPSDIDKIISAEIPDPTVHPNLYKLVRAHMMHGPCGLARVTSQCMKNGRCSKYYPKKFIEDTIVDAEGYPLYRRRSKTFTIEKNGYDRITAAVSTNSNQPVDEIQQYLDCRYVSPSEACWRIYSYNIHGRKPAVERMFYHLVGEKPIYYTDYARMENVLETASVTESMFTAWLVANAKYEEAQTLTYGQFVSKFVYHKKKREWKPRKKGFTIGRLIWVPPTTGELFYLRMMLTVAKGPTTYEEIRTVDNIQYDTFRDACFAMGFLEDDKEYIAAIKEASHWGTGHFLRKLFVIMLLSGAVNRPAHVWEQTWLLLSDGVLHTQRALAANPELDLTQEELQNLTLIEIEKLLQANRRTLKDFSPIPYPDAYVLEQLGNRLIYDERNYDTASMNSEFENLFAALTDEQRSIYEKIIHAVESQKPAVFFLHGYGGTGKTYMWRTLAAALRSKHDICLTVATSGIASLLLPGGRTAHSKFRIPVPTMDNSTCKVEFNDDVADMLRQTKLIIWDEAPMAHKYAIESLDRTLKDVMSADKNSTDVFGGKVVVFGGDFRQILPVVPRGSLSDIVHCAVNASYIWHSVEVLTLTRNMRLRTGSTQTDKNEIAQFSDWLLRIGEGQISEPNDGTAEINIPPDILITEFDDPIVAIVNSTYPDFINNFQCVDYLKSRAILASTLQIVDQINDHILSLMPGEIRDYYNANSVDKSEIHDPAVVDILTPEFLSSLRTSGLPNHHLKLKVGTPIMLMRNIDQAEGLCNGTRLCITKMAAHVLEASIMGGKGMGNLVYIPRMDMSPSQSPWPFKLNRRQFPIIVSYSMTINKSQGQSLDNVGLYLPKDVFTHGQIYVALSRVTTKKGIKILIHDEEKKFREKTTNVVYKEVFNNV